MKKFNILKMAKHISKSKNGKYDRRILHPEREWIIGISFFLILSFAGSIFSARLYVRYSNVDSVNVSSAEDLVDNSSLTLIKEVIEQYDKREEQFNEIASRKSIIIVEEEDEEDEGSEALQDGEAPVEETAGATSPEGPEASF
jgi:hypothetical protein